MSDAYTITLHFPAAQIEPFGQSVAFVCLVSSGQVAGDQAADLVRAAIPIPSSRKPGPKTTMSSTTTPSAMASGVLGQCGLRIVATGLRVQGGPDRRQPCRRAGGDDERTVGSGAHSGRDAQDAGGAAVADARCPQPSECRDRTRRGGVRRLEDHRRTERHRSSSPEETATVALTTDPGHRRPSGRHAQRPCRGVHPDLRGCPADAQCGGPCDQGRHPRPAHSASVVPKRLPTTARGAERRDVRHPVGWRVPLCRRCGGRPHHLRPPGQALLHRGRSDPGQDRWPPVLVGHRLARRYRGRSKGQWRLGVL